MEVVMREEVDGNAVGRGWVVMRGGCDETREGGGLET